MGQVDDFQAGAEAVAQLQEEQARRERERLNAELAATPLAPTAGLGRETRHIALDDIVLGPFNMRQQLTDIEDLARSIAQRGLHTPLEVRPDEEDGTYVLIAGHRRHAALTLIQDARRDEDPHSEMLVRCEVVSDCDDAEHFVLQVIENDVVPLEPKDWARGIRMLMSKYPDWDAKTLATSLGKNTAFVQKYLRLLDLPDAVTERLESGDLSFTSADLLRRGQATGKLDAAQVEDLAEKAASGQITAKALGEQINPPTSAPPQDDDLPWDAEHAAEPVGEFTPELGSREDVAAVEALDRQASALLREAERAQADVSDVELVASFDGPLGPEAVAATAGRDPEWSLLDAYLLGRLLDELADEDVRRQIGAGADGSAFALSLSSGERITALRRLSQGLLQADQDADAAFDAARDAQL